MKCNQRNLFLPETSIADALVTAISVITSGIGITVVLAFALVVISTGESVAGETGLTSALVQIGAKGINVTWVVRGAKISLATVVAIAD